MPQMLNAAQCQALARECKNLAQEPDISADRVTLLNNAAQSFKRLATQLDMIAANERYCKTSQRRADRQLTRP
jgi:hypothetical protein